MEAFKDIGIPDHLTCLLKNLYAGQEATVNMEKLTSSRLRKECGRAVCWHPACLPSLYTEVIMRKARLRELQAGIKTGGRNISNVRYVDETTLLVQS